jgi:hypothetical protein
MGGAEGL